MSFNSTARNDIMKLIFNATAWADMAENDTTGPAANITVALHTADPAGGTQLTSETAYTNYVRISVARTSGGWTVTANSVSPVANIDFAECGATPGSAITHWSVGDGVSNYMIGSGTVSPNITMATGVIPRIKTTSTITLT